MKKKSPSSILKKMESKKEFYSPSIDIPQALL